MNARLWHVFSTRFAGLELFTSSEISGFLFVFQQRINSKILESGFLSGFGPLARILQPKLLLGKEI